MRYEFGSDVLRCTVDERGAELVSVRYCGKERLWQNDNGEWDGHAPVLFPYGGNCAVKVDGKLYPERKHGFLSFQTGALHEKTDDSVTFVFRANDETKAYYPFNFSVFITYLVVGNCLKVTYTACNDGDRTMYAAFGCHESYALDEDVDEYEVVFEKDEKLLSLVASQKNGKLTGEMLDLGEGKSLVLPKAILNDSVILKTNSRSVSLKKRGADEILARIAYPDFENLLLWHPKNSRSVCIEPWQNLPDDDGKPAQELSKKRGLTALEPGEKLVARHEIVYF